MDWTSLIGPAVVAAVVSGIVTTIGFLVNRSTSLTMHQQKLEADRGLAERKFVLDKNLAELKFTYDKEATAWRRRYDLAEQILSSAYEVRDALLWARARVVLDGEGKTRQATEPEAPQLKSDRDSAFVPMERLTAHAKCFATLQTAQDAAVAHFGPSIVGSINQLIAEHRKIATAAAHLIQHASWNEIEAGASC